MKDKDVVLYGFLALIAYLLWKQKQSASSAQSTAVFTPGSIVGSGVNTNPSGLPTGGSTTIFTPGSPDYFPTGQQFPSTSGMGSSTAANPIPPSASDPGWVQITNPDNGAVSWSLVDSNNYQWNMDANGNITLVGQIPSGS